MLGTCGPGTLAPNTDVSSSGLEADVVAAMADGLHLQDMGPLAATPQGPQCLGVPPREALPLEGIG